MSSHAATMTPTVTVTVGTFDATFGPSPMFRVARTEQLDRFGTFADDLYTPDNCDRAEGKHGGGGTPLRDATMSMIHHLDNLRSQDTVTIGLLLDESGSMGPNRTSVIEGVREFVGGLKGIPTSEGGRVLCVIFTDGQENSSRHITPEALRQVVGERENDGWTFIFMGANMDAWGEGSSQMGISGGLRGQSVNFTSSPVGTASAFNETSRRAGAYLKSQVSYDALAGSVGNNSTVDEDGTVNKAEPGPEPSKEPYGDVSKAMSAVTDAFKKIKSS